jgi:DNA polymerase
MMSWAYDDDKPELWEPDGPWDYDSLPTHIVTDITKGIEVCSHNIEFEMQVFWHVLGIQLGYGQVRDTVALALINGYPKSLAGVGAALGLDVQKDKRGQLLIRKFCGPRKPTKNNPLTRNYKDSFPTDWQDFKQYCLTDAVVEQSVWKRLSKCS